MQSRQYSINRLSPIFISYYVLILLALIFMMYAILKSDLALIFATLIVLVLIFFGLRAVLLQKITTTGDMAEFTIVNRNSFAPFTWLGASLPPFSLSHQHIDLSSITTIDISPLEIFGPNWIAAPVILFIGKGTAEVPLFGWGKQDIRKVINDIHTQYSTIELSAGLKEYLSQKK